VITPDGSRVYVASVSNVYSIDTTTNAITPITLANSSPKGLRITPDGTILYVTYTSSTPGVSRTFVATNALLTPSFNAGSAPYSVAFTPSGTRAYIANVNSGTVSFINTTTTPPFDNF
jgi:YVTN family beta-propeller protein